MYIRVFNILLKFLKKIILVFLSFNVIPFYLYSLLEPSNLKIQYDKNDCDLTNGLWLNFGINKLNLRDSIAATSLVISNCIQIVDF